jgi:hypothetical protein
MPAARPTVIEELSIRFGSDGRHPVAVYQVTLHSAPPAALISKFPAITLHATPPTTILSRRGAELADVDRLIERLRSLGITPLEVHASSRNCEFRIEGLLGESALHYMEWAVRLDQERTIIRVAAAPAELQMILKELAKMGIGIDHIIRHPGT